MLGLDDNQKEAIGLDFIMRRLAPASPYGSEALRSMAPFDDPDDLGRCFDNIDMLMRQDFQSLRDILAHFKNIRGILGKLANGTLNEVELFETKGFLLTMERFLPIFDEINAKLQLSDISFDPMTAALDILDPQKLRTAPFSLDDGFSDALADIRREKLHRLGSGRAQLAPTGHAQINEEEIAEEMRIMSELSIKLRPHIPKFRGNIDNLGRLDLAMAKAALAAQYGCVRPQISKNTVALQNMINPMVAAALAQKGRAMTPVSLRLDADGPTIITGANMGGKSVAIKTAVLNAALCVLGMFVFAKKAEIPLFDGIFLVSQDLQDTAAGLSSFGGEVASLNTLATALNTPKNFLFIALDEPARATNPAEGAAIVRAVAAWLAGYPSVSLLSTHYDGITAPNARYYRVAGLANLPQSLSRHEIADFMDYRLIETTAADPIPRDALKICKLLGLDEGLMA
ncbi:MAG: hypothetical protein LBE55_01910 [Clostridiales bacterium]|jgi:dsDNA-specific endonuclease/ATPase MutS2|nr:hypothetical protein [Clostridiales bacterium]